ncbi:MAG: hypothetical protein ACOC58_05075 [Chloroflexota bacterium]
MPKITLEQVVEILNLIMKSSVSEETVQRTLIERFDLLAAMMRHPEAVQAMSLPVFEAFIQGSSPLPAGSRVPQEDEMAGLAVEEYGYPVGWRFRSLREQLDTLGAFFPELRWEAGLRGQLPREAEGWLVVPKPWKLAQTYNEALEQVLGHLQRARPRFSNGREGRLGPEHLSLTDRTYRVLGELERDTPGDFLVLAVQSGLRHRASSVGEVRERLAGDEFCLGPLEIASLLLTHPDRLGDYEHLGIDCPGCRYAPNADGQYSFSLYFIWDGEGLRLDCSSSDAGAPGFGSASGFLV